MALKVSGCNLGVCWVGAPGILEGICSRPSVGLGGSLALYFIAPASAPVLICLPPGCLPHCVAQTSVPNPHFAVVRHKEGIWGDGWFNNGFSAHDLSSVPGTCVKTRCCDKHLQSQWGIGEVGETGTCCLANPAQLVNPSSARDLSQKLRWRVIEG